MKIKKRKKALPLAKMNVGRESLVTGELDKGAPNIKKPMSKAAAAWKDAVIEDEQHRYEVPKSVKKRMQAIKKKAKKTKKTKIKK